MTEKWIEVEQMKRLTMDNVEEMGMYSLAHNCCYIDENRNTKYRDFEIDIDARELAKRLLKEMTGDEVSFESNDDFDDWMGCCIGEDGISTPRGLIATFYQNLWAMAELREKLKYYEDLEEQGRLVVLPETPETEDEIDKVDWSAMQKALEEYEERVKQEEENVETNNGSKGI